MGKFRIKHNAKGKRWIKGQSGVSNPETKTYRDAARSGFCQATLGPARRAASSKLTSTAIEQHSQLMDEDIELSTRFAKQVLSDEDDKESVTSFASDWSGCNNASFYKLLDGFQPTSALQKDMLAVLAAITEFMKSENVPETSEEYFMALLNTLMEDKAEAHITAVISLMKLCIREVPSQYLNTKYEIIMTTLTNLLSKHSDSNNSHILYATISCIIATLKVQNLSIWKETTARQAFNLILAHTIHSKPKIRKCARANVSEVLYVDGITANHPAVEMTVKFFLTQLEELVTNLRNTSILHLLLFLKTAMKHFNVEQIKCCIESILKVMTLGSPRITIDGLDCISSVLIQRPEPLTKNPKLVARLINSLFDFKPRDTDVEQMLPWLTVMQEAFCLLAKTEERDLIYSNLLPFVKHVAWLLEGDRDEMLSTSALALKCIILQGLGHPEEGEHLKQRKCLVNQILDIMESCLRAHCFAAWKYVIRILGALYNVAGNSFPKLMGRSLKLISQVRNYEPVTLGVHVDQAVGEAFSSMGLVAVLDALPLQISFEESICNFPNNWLLMVIKEDVKSAKLMDFVNCLYPIAIRCKNRAEELRSNNEMTAAHSYELHFIQIWSLLPNFCNQPPDFEQGLKTIAKNLGSALNNKTIRLVVLAAIRKLIIHATSTNHEGAKRQLTSYAKNFLPILFNIFTTAPATSEEEGHRLAALETIKLYLELADADMKHNFFDLTIAKLNICETDKKKKTEFDMGDALLQLLTILVCHQDRARMDKLFAITSKLLDSGHHTKQKRGYRLIHALTDYDYEACQQFVKDNINKFLLVLNNHKLTTLPPCRAARLNCYSNVAKHLSREQENILAQMIAEAIPFVKDTTEKCRQAAKNLLNNIVQNLLKNASDPDDAANALHRYGVYILPGLQIDDVNLKAATIEVLNHFMVNSADVMDEEKWCNLFMCIAALSNSPHREIASECIVTFSITVSYFKTDGRSFLPQIMDCILNMNEECKRHLRQRIKNLLCKLVRYYGYEDVTQLVPEKDVIMKKRLSNINKAMARKAQLDDSKSGENPDDESIARNKNKSFEEYLADSDSETETEKSQEKSSNAWIHESGDSFLDFTHHSASKKISGTKPGKKNAAVSVKKVDSNRGFKTAPDGRLIIKDDSDSEEGENKSGNRKTNNNMGQASFSDDEYDEVDVDEPQPGTSGTGKYVLAPGSKRQRSKSVSSDISEPTKKYKAGGSGIHRPIKKLGKKTKKVEEINTSSGASFKATKARGDVKKKGMPDPYAYFPLNATLLNPRKRAKQASKLKRLAVSAKKGAQRGLKMRAKSGNKRN